MLKKMYKVVSPIEKKDGTVAYWNRLGNAHTNRDDSINVYLDTLPLNGKIQLREYTEAELRERSERRAQYASRAPATVLAAPLTSPPATPQELPF
jgi:hypothetical protein